LFHKRWNKASHSLHGADGLADISRSYGNIDPVEDPYGSVAQADRILRLEAGQIRELAP